MSEIIWVMDSDLCDHCDGLLDYFGDCPYCDYDELWEEEEWIDNDCYNLDFDANGKYIGG